MKIIEKIAAKGRDRQGRPTPTIAFLGDSVTQGCFEVYYKNDGNLEAVFDKSHAYHKYLYDILTVLFPEAPVNIINAGISGDNAPRGAERLERDVLSHHPDLTVVCFGLNDCGKEWEGIPRYTAALRDIFTRLKAAGSEVIFMTPNMMNTEVSCHTPGEDLRKFAGKIAERQNAGVLDAYVDAAKKVAEELEIPVCDVYAKWKRMAALGVDTTDLLSNYINHPTREMNRLFAYSLIETMMR